MSDYKFLRHRTNGRVYPYTVELSESPDMEPVTEEQAYPERFKPKRTTKRKTKLDLETKEVPEPPKEGEDELSIDATRGTP